MRIVDAPSGLARKSLGGGALLIFCATASSPLAVLAGSVPTTYAATGVVGVPLSFLVLTAALALWSVGYVAISRYLPSAGIFYASVANGLGRFWGVVAAPVVLLAYNTIQICLYGLLGAVVSGAMSGLVDWPWWAWAALAWVAVSIIGILRARISAGLLGAVLVVEICMILLFDLVAFANPGEGSVSAAPMLPQNLFVAGIGGVFAFGIAGFVGYESAPVYSEEARGHRDVAKATFGALIMLGVLYALSSWAMAVAIGPSRIVEVAQNPDSGLPFIVLERHVSSLLVTLGTFLIITSVFAAMLSFHNSVARYVFTLARERLLPSALDRIGRGTGAGAPIGGSLVQSALAFVVVAIFAASGADPVVTLFTWFSGVAAIAVMLLMIATSFAVVGFFRRGGGRNENAWQRVIAPALGAVAITVILATTVYNISSILGTTPGSTLTWVVPGSVILAAIVGVLWATILKATRPDVFQQVGRGQPKPLAVIEHDLSDLRV